MLNELLKSRYYRLKIQCLILIMYLMFNCNGLIWLTSMHLDFYSEDHVNFFTDEGFAGFGISCVCGLISVVLFMIFSCRIILQYYYKEKDVKWMKCSKLYAKIASFFWFLSMLTWTITILFAEIDGWLFKLALAFVPAWNKTLCIGIIYSIFYEFSPSVSRVQRVVRWISIITIFLSVYVAVLTMCCGISWLMWIFSFFGGIQAVAIVTVYMIILSIVLTPFYNFFFVLWDQLRPNFNFKCYMICVPCCCGCFCHDEWLKGCVPKCCYNRPDIKISTWLIIGMSFVWIVCTIFLNNNECLAEASIIEYAFGFRGAAILVLVFSVLINIELTYSGPVKNRFQSTELVVNQNRNRNIQPVTVTAVTTNTITTTTTTVKQNKNNENDNNDNQQDNNQNEEETLTVR
eukprot:146522_1